jgi:hypothetical protein
MGATHASLWRRRRRRGLRNSSRSRNRNRPRPPRSVRRRTYRCGRLSPEPRHPYGRGRRRRRRPLDLIQTVRDRSYDLRVYSDDLGSLLNLCNRGLVSQFSYGFLGGPVLLHRQFLGRDHVDQKALYPRRKPPVLLAVKQRVRPERVARELLA